MTNKTVNIIALVIDQGNLTFYDTEGKPHIYIQGEPKGEALAQEYTVQKALGHDVVTLQLGVQFPATDFTALSHPKRKKGIRYFVAKVASILGLFRDENTENAQDYAISEEEARRRIEAYRAAALSDASMQVEKIERPIPLEIVGSSDFNPDEDTIVAVTDHGIVPGIENISEQFNASIKGTAPDNGVDNLVERISKVKRVFATNELLSFIKRIDIPPLPDGSYLAYKRLMRIGDKLYVDCASGKVFQRLGDTVQMPEDLVDPSQRLECSTGLHVGTKKYMGGFGRDTNQATVLVLVQPEDTIAVPQGEADKMRLSKYLLLAELSPESEALVDANESLSEDEKLQHIISTISAGYRPPLLGTVSIGGRYGDKLTYKINDQLIPTNITYEAALAKANSLEVHPTQEVAPVQVIDTSKQDHEGYKALLKKERKVITDKSKVIDPKTVKPLTRNELIEVLLDRAFDSILSDQARRNAAIDLKELKKKSKVSWATLGATPEQVTALEEVILLTESQPKADVPKVTAPAVTDTAKDAKSVVGRFKKSGQSQTAFAAKEGIPRRTLGRWIEKHG